jgi:probable O-glycosylation ligase (exosortase A-associated)
MLRLLLVLGIMVPGLIAALFSRFSGLLLYLWFAFFRPQEWSWIDISSLRFSAIALTVLVLPSLMTGVFPDIKHPISRGMGVLALSAVLAELVTPAPRASIEWLQITLQTAIVSLLLVTLVDTAAKLRTLLVVVTFSIGYHACVRGFSALTSGGFEVVEGIGGAFGDNNSFAVGCAMIAALFFTLAREFPTVGMRIVSTFGGVLTLLTVIATSSRGGFLAAAAGMLTFALLRKMSLRWLAGMAIASALFYTYAPTPEGYADRLRTIQTYEEDESASSRLHFWRVAVDMSQAQPLGVGVQNFNNVFDQYDFLQGQFGKGRSVHSSHLQILTEAGVIGFAAWIFLLLYSVLVGLKVRKRVRTWTGPDARLYASLADGLVAAWVAFIIGGTFTAIGWNDFVWTVFGITAALDCVTRAEERQRDAESRNPEVEAGTVAGGFDLRPALDGRAARESAARAAERPAPARAPFADGDLQQPLYTFTGPGRRSV